MVKDNWVTAYDAAAKLYERKENNMKFAAKSGVDFELAPAGNHVAICNAVVDLGLQPGSGMYPDPKHQVYLRFELPTEQTTYAKNGEEISGPMVIGRTFTASMSKKANLRKFIESWFGKNFPDDDTAANFEHEKLLGHKCLLNITHNESKSTGNTYATPSNATPIPKGMQSEYDQHNGSLFLDLEQWDQAAFDALPEWLRDKVDGRLEADVAPEVEYATEPELDDEVPF